MSFQGSRPKNPTFLPSSQWEAVPKSVPGHETDLSYTLFKEHSGLFATAVGDLVTSLQKVQKSEHRGDRCLRNSCRNRR